MSVPDYDLSTAVIHSI